MARINLVITCGCGFSTRVSATKTPERVLEEAKDHSDKAKHSLCIGGVVEKKVE